ncbi:MAG TPA: SDR family NAD(P)-dependent oxidoreductase, partial [Salinimicrobium sp.]|nr:SDR family NAD(P)-dependent oxidoreductase [Salinimicrobium sp.]
KGFLAETEALIIDIPPGLRKNPKNDFVSAMKNLEKEIEHSEVKNVIFVSSISVYEDAEDFPVYSEKDFPNAIYSNGAQLISAEKIFIQNTLFGCTVIRFGGLIGGKRHPVRQLAGRTNLANPQAPVNLIQMEDCIAIILKIIEKGAFGHVFNAVFPEHPSKKSYYQKRANEEGLPLPEFAENGISKGKIIVSDHLEKQLDFEFGSHI